jgi:hypothetical protein
MAVHFDGSSDTLYVYDIAAWYHLPTPVTISLWVSMDTITDGRVLYTTGGGGWGCKQIADNKVNIHVRDSDGWHSRNTDALQTDTWYHFCTKITGSNVQFYIDGTEMTNPLTPGWNGTISYGGVVYIHIGGYVGGTEYTGCIDEFAIWDSALTDGEIVRLASGKKRIPLLTQRSNLQLYYPFDDRNVGSVYGEAKDYSGNGRDTWVELGNPTARAGALGYLSNPMVGGGGQ